MEHWILYGDELANARFPDRTRLVEGPPIEAREALPDPDRAIREAIRSPIAHEPLRKLVGRKSRVTIAFDDPTVGVQGPPDFRERAIRILLEELDRAGVERRNVTLLCANALHRMWTRAELGKIIGEELAYTWPVQRLRCHDAEDKEQVVYLGETERGQEVEVSRSVVDSDQLIYVNVTPSPMNGGWKSIVVGLSTFRSIRHHHRPFPYAGGKSVMDAKRSSFQKLLWEMGALVEAHLAKSGRRIFSIESVTNGGFPAETAAVFAGHTPEVHERTLEALQRRQVVDVDGQSDVVVYGVPNRDPYSTFSKINPILLANLGLAYIFGMYQNRPLAREGGILILANPFERFFHSIHHPSYAEFFDRVLDVSRDPVEIWDLFAEEFANRPELVHRYRHGYGFHGAHPFFMWNSRRFPCRHLGAIFVAGAKDFKTARRLGFEPFGSVEDAISEAENRMGRDCSITFHVMPPLSIARVS